MAERATATSIIPDELIGTVDRVVYQSTENGFVVFTLAVRAQQQCTVRAYAPNLTAGVQIHVTGTWVMHPKFGKQFEAHTCTLKTPSTVTGLKKYLASGMVKGIGPVIAEKLVSHFGTDILTIIDAQPERLHEVNGIGEKRIARIVDAWRDQKEISTIMVFLQDKGVSPALATKIYKKYGSRAQEILTQNPYRLADDVWGVGFKTADAIARSLGFADDCPQRIAAGIIFALTSQVGSGHLYTDIAALNNNICTLLSLATAHGIPLIEHHFARLRDENQITCITYNQITYAALTSHYGTEKSVASTIRWLLKQPATHRLGIQALYTRLRTNTGIPLTDDQQRGIITCLTNKVTIITGGPGTGKTTLIKELIGILEHERLRYRLAAPTGRAAKRITESTRRSALTIHRLLEFDVSTRSFLRNERNALPLDFLIVDEASMIDIFLARSLLKAIPENAHVVFIGDVDQLPSVGPGNVLNDLIASGIVPMVRLTTIFRQAQNSMIIINAHRINRGEFPLLHIPDAQRDFLYIKEEDPELVSKHLQKLFTTTLARQHIAPDQTMVLTPMNRGAVGTHKLNYDLQGILNSNTAKASYAHAGTLFKVDDRVMQIRNNYDKLVFNGDIGTITAIDHTDRQLMVQFVETEVVYEFTELDELVLAYAISIHKSQGSEYPAVIIPLFMQHFTLLQRNLIYTAITRAKQLCILIGQPKAIGCSLRATNGLVRRTFLQQMLTEQLV